MVFTLSFDYLILSTTFCDEFLDYLDTPCFIGLLILKILLELQLLFFQAFWRCLWSLDFKILNLNFFIFSSLLSDQSTFLKFYDKRTFLDYSINPILSSLFCVFLAFSELWLFWNLSLITVRKLRRFLCTIYLLNCVDLLFTSKFAHTFGIFARISFCTVLTSEYIMYRLHRFDFPLCVISSPMVPQIHGFREAFLAYFAFVFTHKSCLFLGLLHLFPFFSMGFENMLVQVFPLFIWTAAETAAVLAFCGLVLALRQGTVGTLVHLFLGWLDGIPYVLTAQAHYSKFFFTTYNLLFYCLGTFDTVVHFLDFIRGTFDTVVQLAIFDFCEAKILSFLDQILTWVGAIDSLRRGGSSGGRCIRRRCGLRKALFYFRVSHLLYLHVLNSL